MTLKEMRETILTGLREHLGIKMIRADQTSPAPAYPYGTAKATTPAGANNGTYQKHEDGIDRLMVQSIWSFSFLSKDYDESVSLALKARQWFLHTGRVWLSDRGITVSSATEINNRDNILTVDYESKHGFDVFFYVYDEAENPAEATGYIESAEVSHNILI